MAFPGVIPNFEVNISLFFPTRNYLHSFWGSQSRTSVSCNILIARKQLFQLSVAILTRNSHSYNFQSVCTFNVDSFPQSPGSDTRFCQNQAYFYWTDVLITSVYLLITVHNFLYLRKCPITLIQAVYFYGLCCWIWAVNVLKSFLILNQQAMFTGVGSIQCKWE